MYALGLSPVQVSGSGRQGCLCSSGRTRDVSFGVLATLFINTKKVGATSKHDGNHRDGLLAVWILKRGSSRHSWLSSSARRRFPRHMNAGVSHARCAACSETSSTISKKACKNTGTVWSLNIIIKDAGVKGRGVGNSEFIILLLAA